MSSRRDRDKKAVDLNLLFGMIALQTNFITREQLVAAFDNWVRDKSRNLGQILISNKALSDEDHDALTRLVTRFTTKHGGDAERSLAAISSIPQVRPDLERLADADLEASLGHLGRDACNECSLPKEDWDRSPWHSTRNYTAKWH